MKRIDKLTPAQEARFGEWTRKWIDIGLSTEPADFDAVTDAALKAYALCGLERPMIVLRMGSPYATTVGGAMAWSILKLLKLSSSAQVRDQVRAQVRDQVEAQVWAQVRVQVRDQVEAQVWAQVEAQVGAQVRDQVEAQVGAQVRDQVREQVRDQVRDQVGDQVWAGAFQAAKDGLNNDGASNIGWAGWCSWVSFFVDVCGLDGPRIDRFSIAETLTKSCGWTWWHQNVLAISDRPRTINHDAAGRLHCEDGPSIAYRDGWALHHWHGVCVPSDWIEQRKTLDPAVVLKEQNVEKRRAGCEIIGWARLLKLLKAKTIDTDTPDIGTLVQVDLPDAPKEKFLMVHCATN
jgi:hypothetical protein